SKYQRIVEGISPLVNSIAAYVPKRRARKLHIGLFGYSRNVGGIVLPRAIPFASAFYSLGIPPECIGASVLEDFNEREYETFMKYYKNIKSDFEFAGGYLSWQNVNMLLDMYQDFASRVPMSKEKLKYSLTLIMADFKVIEEKLSLRLGSRTLSHRKHENLVSNFLISYHEKEDNETMRSLLEAASIRKGLG
ncbi:MAG TPA: phosphoenolpyruvate carboxylase, partial [Nitrososphaerales archaeon]